MKKTILTLFVLALASVAGAQQRMVLEKMRCLSAVGPVMNYLRDPLVRKTIAAQLSHSLTDNGFPALSDTSQLPNLEFPPRITDLLRSDLNFTDNDTATLHLYIDLWEVSPALFFSSVANASSDTTLYQRARSVFVTRAYIFNHDKKQLFAEELNIVATAGVSLGMGTYYQSRSGSLTVTPRGFSELFRLATRILFDPSNELALVETKVAPAFVVDDYILPHTIHQPRIFFTTKKAVSGYTYNGKSEMIRMGDTRYEEIVMKGKNAVRKPDALLSVIKDQPNTTGSDFVWLHQVCRDVLRDKNYLVKLVVQIDPTNIREEPYVFTQFLPGQVHCLLLENDTIAQFSILPEIVDDTQKIYPAKVYNGTDSASFFTVSPQLSPTMVKYEYVIEGTIGKQPFTIRCSGGRNTVKELVLAGKRVGIVQGKFIPEKIVVFDASLSPEILNPLLMIGFNRFLE